MCWMAHRQAVGVVPALLAVFLACRSAAHTIQKLFLHTPINPPFTSISHLERHCFTCTITVSGHSLHSASISSAQ